MKKAAKPVPKKTETVQITTEERYVLYCLALNDLVKIGEKLGVKIETDDVRTWSPKENSPKKNYAFFAKLHLDIPFPIRINSEDITDSEMGFLHGVVVEIDRAIKEYGNLTMKCAKPLEAALPTFGEFLQNNVKVRTLWLQSRLSEYIIDNIPKSMK